MARNKTVTLGWSLEAKAAYWTDIGGPDECWPWMGTRKHHGYPHLGWQRKVVNPQRLLSNVPQYLQIRHTCDQPWCMNPAHWLHGTHADNQRDKHLRGRTHLSAKPGTTNGCAKLTDAQVLQLRHIRRTTNAKFTELGQQFGISATMAAFIVNRQKWRHLP